MISIKITGVESIQKLLGETSRRTDTVIQRALIKTAHHVREAEQAEMKRVFDRPTRWTLGSMRVKPTAKMEVLVGVVDPDGYYKRAHNYLATQIGGGNRRMKAMETALQQYGVMPNGWIAVPGAGAKLDSYGNMSPGQIRQILSWFDVAERWAGSTQNMREAGRDKRRKGTRKSVGFEYFVVHPNRPNRGHRLTPGIYQRFFFAMGKSIKPVLVFVRGAKYKARFDFERVARRTMDKHMPNEVDIALKREIKGLFR